MSFYDQTSDEEKSWYCIKTDRSSEHFGDCLELMPLIPDKSIDMILADLPYGTTACKWDAVIPFKPLWKEYKRIIKNNGAIVLTASQPFTTALINSNMQMFGYEWIWEKDKPTNFALANKQTMKYHENICVFYKKQPTYNKQVTSGHKSMNVPSKRTTHGSAVKMDINKDYCGKTTRNPKSIIKFNTVKHNSPEGGGLHPTQKPVALFEYLIKTYTNENEIVLDNTAGVFTTAIACLNTNRKYIVMEKDKEYYRKGITRIAKWKKEKEEMLPL